MRKSVALKVFARRPTMRQRLNAGLLKMMREGLEVRAIYLTEQDHNRLDREMHWRGRPTSLLSYQGYPIRRGKTTAIYSTHGIARSLPTLARRRRAQP